VVYIGVEMETTNLDKLKIEIIQWKDRIVQDQQRLLWKFLFYYFLMENRELKRNQIGEIEDYLSYCKIPQDNWQYLDENITAFLLGYRILQETGRGRPFRDKANTVKNELEKHWDDESKEYFRNSTFTLLILFSDDENPHKEDILKKSETFSDYGNLALTFLIIGLQRHSSKEKLEMRYIDLFKKIQREFYDVRDSEKIYISWILWKYRKLLLSEIKEIRKNISSFIFTRSGQVSDELKEGILDLETVLFYDLLHNFENETRLAVEEVPITFRLLGAFSGSIIFISMLFVDFHLWRIGYLHPGGVLPLNIAVNIIIVLVSVFVVYFGGFLIYEIGYKGIFADKEIKQKLKQLVQKYFWGFVVGAVIFGFVLRLI